MRKLAGLLLALALYAAGTFLFINTAIGTPVNLTEHSWIYNSGYISDQRIYQTEKGYHGQKAVTGTSGSGTVSRTISAQVYGGYSEDDEDVFWPWDDEYGDELYLNEWGVYQARPYTPPLTQGTLKNALCAKNYEVGTVYSESYSDIRDLVKDTTAIQDDDVSVYDVHSEITGTARVGSIVRRSSGGVSAYTMSGTYMGYTNMNNQIEASANPSILTLPCP